MKNRKQMIKRPHGKNWRKRKKIKDTQTAPKYDKRPTRNAERSLRK